MQEAQKGNQVFEGNDRQTQETNDEFENLLGAMEIVQTNLKFQ